MAEQDLIDRLDDAVEAMLRRPETARVPDDPELAALWRVAADLADVPRAAFRQRLAAEIERRARMQIAHDEGRHAGIERERPSVPLPEGFGTITPYLVVRGADRLIEFMKQAFGAEEKARALGPDGRIMHAELRIGDSVVELGDAGERFTPRPAAMHLYVPDADATYARAVAAGARTLLGPTDMPYGDREADVTDPFGNNWYIATRQQGGPVPSGMRTLTTTLHAHGTDRLIDFIKEAFGAEELDRTLSPEGLVVHAQLRLGDSMLELGEARPGFIDPMPCGLHYFVDDPDAVYERALRAGATSNAAPSDRPYGQRVADVSDPFGNRWFIAKQLGSGANRQETES